MEILPLRAMMDRALILTNRIHITEKAWMNLLKDRRHEIK
jgi:hypothetical protein